MPDPITEREREILDGSRRVFVSDLAARGLVADTVEVEWRRPNLGQMHRARIQPDGTTIVENEDGDQPFPSMSAAASTLAGQPTNAWVSWTVRTGPGSGCTLAKLREQLLDLLGRLVGETDSDPDLDPVVDEADQDADEPALGTTVSDFLDDAVARSATDPVHVTVTELLAAWRASRRGAIITGRIQEALANAGLRTEPDFTQVSLDTSVLLVAAEPGGQDPRSETAVPDAPGDASALERRVEAEPETPSTSSAASQPSTNQGVALGTLADSAPLVSVAAGAPLDKAITLMSLNDFGQLGVLGAQKALIGAVTWRSIAHALHRSGARGLKVQDALVRAVRLPFAHPLLRAIPDIARDGFVFVDQPGHSTSIVTATDLATAYGKMASPFLLIGEADRLLRGVLLRLPASVIPSDVVVEDAMFGDYVKTLAQAQAWEALGWPLDRRDFIVRLREVNDLRNDLMHFNNVDPPAQADVERIHLLVEVLRSYSGEIARG